jgi:hypothetical protein
MRDATTLDRRLLLAGAGLAPLIGAFPLAARAAEEATTKKPDYTLRIATGPVELSSEHIVSTTLYNGQFPRPLIRLQEGKRFCCRCLQRHRRAGTRPLARADDPERR